MTHLLADKKSRMQSIAQEYSATSGTFPFVTLFNLELFTAGSDDIVVYTPIVPASLQNEWRNYSQAQAPIWLSRSYDLQTQLQNANANAMTLKRRQLQTSTSSVNGTLPIWQTSPPMANLVNSNWSMVPNIQASASFAIEHKVALYTEFITADIGLTNATATNGPMTLLMTPVFSNLTSSNVAALVSTPVDWLVLMQQIQQAHLTVVVTSTCGDGMHSYSVGENVSTVVFLQNKLSLNMPSNTKADSLKCSSRPLF
jgi:hypothetical protein